MKCMQICIVPKPSQYLGVSFPSGPGQDEVPGTSVSYCARLLQGRRVWGEMM